LTRRRRKPLDPHAGKRRRAADNRRVDSPRAWITAASLMTRAPRIRAGDAGDARRAAPRTAPMTGAHGADYAQRAPRAACCSRAVQLLHALPQSVALTQRVSSLRQKQPFA